MMYVCMWLNLMTLNELLIGFFTQQIALFVNLFCWDTATSWIPPKQNLFQQALTFNTRMGYDGNGKLMTRKYS